MKIPSLTAREDTAWPGEATGGLQVACLGGVVDRDAALAVPQLVAHVRPELLGEAEDEPLALDREAVRVLGERERRLLLDLLELGHELGPAWRAVPG